MLDLLTPLNTAWERTALILFRPFDFEKWAKIAFASFLIAPIEGGLNYNGSFTEKNAEKTGFPHDFTTLFSWMTPFYVAVILVAVLAIIVLCIGLSWLRARGEFMLLDNIVRNRGAIVEPWNRYAQQANNLFIFNLIVGVIWFMIVAIVTLPMMCLLLFLSSNHWGVFPFVMMFLAFFFAILLPGMVVFLNFQFFGIPLMFRNGISAWSAFKKSTLLCVHHPLSILLLLLVCFFMFIAFLIIVVLGSLLTCCCLAILLVIPYVNAFVQLPLTVFFRTYLLDVMAQFGPEYNLWTMDHDNLPIVPPRMY